MYVCVSAYIPNNVNVVESPGGSIIVVAESAPIIDIASVLITTVSEYKPASTNIVSPETAIDKAFVIVR